MPKETTQDSPAVDVGAPPFSPLPSGPAGGTPIEMDVLLDIPVTISVELGRVKLPLENVTQFAPGMLVELPRIASEPVDLLVNGTPVARAEVVTVGEKYGVRIVELVSPEERLKRMAKTH